MKTKKIRSKLLISLMLTALLITTGVLSGCDHKHVYVKDEGIEATCTDKGKTDGAHCSTCNHILVEQKEIDELPHDYSDWSTVKEANCTETGLKERQCKNCEHMDSQIIPALGHTYVKDESSEPTFNEAGYTAGVHCKRCNDILLAQEEIAKLRFEDFAYRVDFATDSHIRVIVYETQDYTRGGETEFDCLFS